MKYSGVEWIGEIPRDWDIVTTKRFFRNEKRVVGESVDDYQRLALTMNGVLKRSKDDSDGLQPEKFEGYQILKQHELVFKLIDLENVKTSRVGLSPYTGIVSPAYIVLTNQKDDNRFFYYWFISMYYNEIFNQLGGAGVRSALNAKEVLNLPIISMPETIQHRIADYLDRKCSKIDEIIEKEGQVIEKLKAYKLSVITEAVTKGLDPNVTMKDSGVEWIGEIPVSWETPKIKYLASVSSGGTPDRGHPEYWNGDINWIKTGELQNNEIYEVEEQITEEGLNSSSAQIFNVDTILMAMYGQGKTRGMTALLKVSSSTNQACAGIVINNKKMTIPFMWKSLIGSYDAIREKANGSGQPNLSQALIKDFYIPMPPINEQEEICKYIDSQIPLIDSAINKKELIIEKLTAYKKSLIYEVVTGKKEV